MTFPGQTQSVCQLQGRTPISSSTTKTMADDCQSTEIHFIYLTACSLDVNHVLLLHVFTGQSGRTDVGQSMYEIIKKKKKQTTQECWFRGQLGKKKLRKRLKSDSSVLPPKEKFQHKTHPDECGMNAMMGSKLKSKQHKS